MPVARRKPWFTVKPASDGPTAAGAVIEIRGSIGGFDANEMDLVEQINALGDQPEVTVLISSLGGSCVQAFAIYTALVRSAARVTVRVQSIAASAASVIAMAGDQVIMERGSSMMVHRSSGYAEGNIHKLGEAVKLLETMDDSMAEIYAARTGAGTTAEWMAAMDATSFFTASQAVEVGLADVGPDDDADAALPELADLAAIDPAFAKLVGTPTAADEFVKAVRSAVTELPASAAGLVDVPPPPVDRFEPASPAPTSPAPASPAPIPAFGALASMKLTPAPFAALTRAVKKETT